MITVYVCFIIDFHWKGKLGKMSEKEEVMMTILSFLSVALHLYMM